LSRKKRNLRQIPKFNSEQLSLTQEAWLAN
jgi:hypothetical protein